MVSQLQLRMNCSEELWTETRTIITLNLLTSRSDSRLIRPPSPENRRFKTQNNTKVLIILLLSTIVIRFTFNDFTESRPPSICRNMILSQCLFYSFIMLSGTVTTTSFVLSRMSLSSYTVFRLLVIFIWIVFFPSKYQAT